MLKHTIMIVVVLLLITTCTKKKEKDIASRQIVTMQDVSDEMRFRVNDTEHYRSIFDDTSTTEPPVTQTETSVIETTPEPPVTQTVASNYQSGRFTAQFLAASNRSKVEAIKRKLDNAGYETEITTITRNGQRLYRLRLAGSYSKSYAEELAKEVVSRFRSDINDYWITTR